MADKSLQWIAFLFGRSTSDDATRTVKDPIGFMYCRLSTARFLDIEDLQYKGTNKTKRKAHTRGKTLADGTVLGGKDAQVAESEIISTPKRKPGGKNIKLVTGKRTAKGNLQTLSFNFPSFATNLVIADALGELIPATKIKSDPTSTDIFPYAITPAGGRIAILSKPASSSSPAGTVAITPQITLQLLQRLGGDFLVGAG